MSGGTARDPLEAGIVRALDLVRRLPLRWAASDEGRSVDTVLEAGCFEGAEESARVLSTVAALEIVEGGGFGGTWPLLQASGRVLAPGMPAAVGAASSRAVDGEYRRDGEGIWREAVGVDEAFLTIGEPRAAPPGAEFELLCFGETERYTVRAGVLEIEDLFGLLAVPATADLLDRVLVRGRRLKPEALSSVRAAEHAKPQVVEVRRPLALSAKARWRDAEAFLAARADIASTRSRGGRVEIIGADKAASMFALEEHEAGWRLTLQKGRYPLTAIHLEQRSTTLHVRAALADWIDGLAPGVRGRLFFDLRSDLVTLG